MRTNSHNLGGWLASHDCVFTDYCTNSVPFSKIDGTLGGGGGGAMVHGQRLVQGCALSYDVTGPRGIL